MVGLSFVFPRHFNSDISCNPMSINPGRCARLW
jgi:hypothetical protein